MAANDETGLRTVVLLGASNLSMGLPAVLRILRSQHPGPLRVFAARGHGRSYANRSRVLWRELPGILECGLWSALSDRAAGSRPDAVITDVGNDLVYGSTPATLIGWVEGCIDRLESVDARILVTRLPVASLERLSRVRFELVRRLFFPSHPLELDQTIDRVHETNDRLGALAQRRGIPTVAMNPDWYGLDPVHFRVRRRRAAWTHILAVWNAETAETADVASPETGHARVAPDVASPPETGHARVGHARVAPEIGHTPAEIGHARVASRFLTSRRAKPERWWSAGHLRSSAQPARRLADGSELWLF